MSLADRTKTALDETRTLMLGAQILLGFQLQAPFQNAFAQLDEAQKAIELAVLAIMVLVLGLLVLPGARHRIVEDGEATGDINRFITATAQVVLAPFALALALDVGLALTQVAGAAVGAAAGALAGLAALGCWYGPLLMPHERKEETMPTSDEKTPIEAKIDYVLTEARVILPGAQALLGFQFAIVLTTGFAEIAPTQKAMHGLAIGLIAVATMLLMAPAAFHRIVYSGAPDPAFHRIAGRFLLAATVFLALGLAADIEVVVGRIGAAPAIAHVAALASVFALLGLWHAWPWWLRAWRKEGDRLAS